MEKIEKETCIKFEERSKNQHKELVPLMISNMPLSMVVNDHWSYDNIDNKWAIQYSIYYNVLCYMI